MNCVDGGYHDCDGRTFDGRNCGQVNDKQGMHEQRAGFK